MFSARHSSLRCRSRPPVTVLREVEPLSYQSDTDPALFFRNISRRERHLGFAYHAARQPFTRKRRKRRDKSSYSAVSSSSVSADSDTTVADVLELDRFSADRFRAAKQRNAAAIRYFKIHEQSNVHLVESRRRLYRYVWKHQISQLLRVGCCAAFLVLLAFVQLYRSSTAPTPVCAPREDERGSRVFRLLQSKPSPIAANFSFGKILENLVSNAVGYFMVAWIFVSLPLGLAFCCWLCAQRSYQKLVAVSPY